jgi:MFS family permease
MRIDVEQRVWAPGRRVLTAGLVLTITLAAFEALAVVTILPLIAEDLQGLRLYGWVTSAFFLGTLVGVVVAGQEADRRGPAPPFAAGLAVFAAGLRWVGPHRPWACWSPPGRCKVWGPAP